MATMDSEDIYKDLDLCKVDFSEMIDKLKNDKDELSNQIKRLEEHTQNLCSELEVMKHKHITLSVNISELFNTAKTEIERKDRLIQELRREKDDLIFKRVGQKKLCDKKVQTESLSKKRTLSEITSERFSKRMKYDRDSSNSRSNSRGLSRSNSRDRSHRSDSRISSRYRREQERNRIRHSWKTELIKRNNSERKSESKQSSDDKRTETLTRRELTNCHKENSKGKEVEFKSDNKEISGRRDFVRSKCEVVNKKRDVPEENSGKLEKRKRISTCDDENIKLSQEKCSTSETTFLPKNADQNEQSKSVFDKKENVPVLPQAAFTDVNCKSKVDEVAESNFSSLDKDDNLMEYLQIQPKVEKNEAPSKDNPKPKAVIKSKSAPKGKIASKKILGDSTKEKTLDLKNSRLKKQSTTNHNKENNTRLRRRSNNDKQGSNTKRRGTLNLETSLSDKPMEDLCEQRELIKKKLDEINRDEGVLSAVSDQVAFLAKIEMSPVIKVKQKVPNGQQVCIDKLEEPESVLNEVTSTSFTAMDENNIGKKKSQRLSGLIDKLSVQKSNKSMYSTFADNATSAFHSTLKSNDCQPSSTNTTLTEETSFKQPETSVTVDPVCSVSLNASVNDNNNTVFETSSNNFGTESNISSSNQNSTLSSSINTLNNSSDANQSIRTTSGNRRRRCVVKIVG